MSHRPPSGGRRSYYGTGRGSSLGRSSGRGGTYSHDNNSRVMRGRERPTPNKFNVTLNLFRMTLKNSENIVWNMYTIDILPLRKLRTPHNTLAEGIPQAQQQQAQQQQAQAQAQPQQQQHEEEQIPEKVYDVGGNNYIRKDARAVGRFESSHKMGSNDTTRKVLKVLHEALLEDNKVITTTGGTVGFSPEPLFEGTEHGYGVVVDGRQAFWVTLTRINDANTQNLLIQGMDTCVKHWLSHSARWSAFGREPTTFFLPEDQKEHLLKGRGHIFQRFNRAYGHLTPAIGATTAIKVRQRDESSLIAAAQGGSSNNNTYYVALNNRIGFLYKNGAALLDFEGKKIAGVPFGNSPLPIQDPKIRADIEKALKNITFFVRYERGERFKNELRNRNPEWSEDKIKEKAIFSKSRLRMFAEKGGDVEYDRIKWASTDWTFTLRTGDKVTVKEYYENYKGINLNHPDLPIICCGRNGYFPIEFLFHEEDRVQNANEDEMVKSSLKYHDNFAVGNRIKHIESMRIQADVNSDKNVLEAFSLKMDNKPSWFEACQLSAPQIIFGNDTLYPTDGSLNIDRLTFKRPVNLTSFAAIDLTNIRQGLGLEHALRSLFRRLGDHGMHILNNIPNSIERLIERGGETHDNFNPRKIYNHFEKAIEKAKTVFLHQDLCYTNIVLKDGTVKQRWVSRYFIPSGGHGWYYIPHVSDSDGENAGPTHWVTPNNRNEESYWARIQFFVSGCWIDPEYLRGDEAKKVDYIGYMNRTGQKERASNFRENPPIFNHPGQNLTLDPSWQIQCPALVFVYLPKKNAALYDFIKYLSCHVFGINTQCMVKEKAAQFMGKTTGEKKYYSGLAHKLNNKLYCKTNNALSFGIRQLDWYSKPNTMVVGYSMSQSRIGGRPVTIVAGAVCFEAPMQIGQDVKMYIRDPDDNADTVKQEVLKELMKNLTIAFLMQLDEFPTRVLVYRDGGSDGSFERIREKELGSISKGIHEAVFERDGNAATPRITFVVAQSNHNLVMVPKDGNSKNVPSGTVVENIFRSDQFDFDFLLTSQRGLKGTSKPLYFKVLVNDNEKREEGFDGDELLTKEKLVNLTYHLSFQYQKAATAPRKLPVLLTSEILANRVVKCGCYITELLNMQKLKIHGETGEILRNDPKSPSVSLLWGYGFDDNRCTDGWRVPFAPTITC